jgi:hypothetical protein
MQPVVDGEASTAPNHIEAFPKDVSELSTAAAAAAAAATNGYRLSIHGNLEFAGTVSAADPVSVSAGHFKGVYAPSEMYAVLDTAPPSVLKLPVD